MRKHTELRVIILLAVLLGAVGLLGRAAAPPGTSRDPRLSTRLTGPMGASAFRAALTRLGTDVSEWRRPLFELGRAAPPDRRVLFAVLAPAGSLTRPEIRNARDWVAHGGSLLLGGGTGIEACFGYTIEASDSARQSVNEVIGAPTATPDQVPVPRSSLRRLDRDEQAKVTACPLLAPDSAERLWRNGYAAGAVRLHYRSGGEALLVADPRIFRNSTLRNTDAGPMLLDWVLARHPRALVVDEYHQGFGRAGSLPGAVVQRIWNTPIAWLFLQLLVAGALVVGLAAVRFGPERPAIDRRRRSPLEHLDALASGLERTHSSQTAIELIRAGLKRRLGTRGLGIGDRATIPHPPSPAPIARQTPDMQVMHAATEVEDLWESLKTTRTRS
jgi:hypothetical protein